MVLVARFGVSIDPELLAKFDDIILKQGYTTRSEAIRDLIRKSLIDECLLNPLEEAVGVMTLLYDHHKHNLTTNLLHLQHESTQTILSTMHIHIDSRHCLEIIVLKGVCRAIETLADSLRAIKGVKYGDLTLTKIVD